MVLMVSVLQFLTVQIHLHRQAVVENVDTTTEISEVDRHVSNRSIAQELKIAYKTVLSHLRKIKDKNGFLFY